MKKVSLLDKKITESHVKLHPYFTIHLTNQYILIFPFTKNITAFVMISINIFDWG